MASTSPSSYKVFISHAGEDKITIAFPLREKLLQYGITAFADEKDMPGGTWSEQAMTTAMETADIAVVVLSPEFVARKWPMKELLCFLSRSEKPLADGRILPVVIPLFYRLTVQELYNEPRLDRTDESGTSLYRVSRFFERMESGEPEANIANIKAALRKIHGAMGVENYVDASNDSTSHMLKRRNVLLNDLCEQVQNAMARISQDVTSTPMDSCKNGTEFLPQFHKEDSVSDLVFDFQEECGDGNPTTIEASVLQALLNSSQGSVISIQGIGGVGKTSILQGLSALVVVTGRFRHGTYLISLGAHATPSGLIRSLCKVVQVSGGGKKVHEMRKEQDWKEVIKHFRSWFAKRECLFMIDDLWETSEITSAMIHELLKLHLSGTNSKVLMSTRSVEIASRAGKWFVIPPREPQGSHCHAILVLHSGIQVDNTSEEDKIAVTEILRRCSGLPLFLKLAGRAVRALSLRHGSQGNIAYRLYSRTLEDSMQGLLSIDVDSYTRLASSLSVSIRLLEDRKERWGFPVHLSTAEMHRRLSVLEKQSRVPMNMLRHLWELKSEAEATVVAREFGQMALATMFVKEANSGYAEHLGAHDSLLEYALGETRKHGEEALGHKILLEVYGRGLERERDCRTWWSRLLKADGYVHSHICRHLALAGLKDELVSLLLKPEWTIRLLEVCGILDLEQGYSLGIAVVKKIDEADEEVGKRQYQQEERIKEAETALRMVSRATRLALGYKISSPRELCFQLYGRLQILASENVAIKEYLNRLQEKAEELWGPWLRCITSPMTSPGGAKSKIFDVHPGVRYINVDNSGDVIYCGCDEGRILVVDAKSGDVLKQWVHSFPASCDIPELIVPQGWLSSMVCCTYRNLLCSGSSVGAVSVWDMKTGSLQLTFHLNFSLGHLLAIGDGRLVVAGSTIGDVQVLDLESGRMIHNPFIACHKSSVCMAMLPDGEHIVSGGYDTTLMIRNVMNGEQIGDSFIGHDRCVTCVATMPDGRHIVSGSGDCTVRIWNISKRNQVWRSFRGHVDYITCVAVSRDGKRVASGSRDCIIRVWDVASGDEVNHTGEDYGCNASALLFHPVDGTVISCSQSSKVYVWDVNNATRVKRSLDRHEARVTRITFTSDGMYVVSGSLDQSLRIWDATSGRQVGNPLRGHSSEVTSVAVTPDDQRVVSVSRDKTVRIWDFQSHVLLHTFTGHTDKIDCVALSRNGDQALTSSADGIVWVWNISTGEGGHFVLNPYREGRNYIDPDYGEVRSSVFITDDGLRAVGVFENDIIMWNIETRQVIKAWRGIDSFALGMTPSTEIRAFVGERSPERKMDPISLNGERILYVEYSLDALMDDGSWVVDKTLLLGILQSGRSCWALSPQKTTLCIGWDDGCVSLMKLHGGFVQDALDPLDVTQLYD